MLPPITSLQNPRIKEAVKLRDRRGREKQGRILIEGVREIGRAIASGVELSEVFLCEPLCDAASAAELFAELRRQSRASLFFVSEPVMQKLSFGDRQEGLLAIARPPMRTLENFASHEPAVPLYAVVEGLEKPGNLGAILRTADAAGISGAVLADGGTDLFNPGAIRASLGAIFTVPVCSASSAETLAWLRQRKLRIFTTRVDATLTYSAADFTAPCAIVLGSEAHGLSSLWSGSDIVPLSLPMLGSVDSLNLSVTAAILFYEALRQRTAAPQRADRG